MHHYVSADPDALGVKVASDDPVTAVTLAVEQGRVTGSEWTVRWNLRPDNPDYLFARVVTLTKQDVFSDDGSELEAVARQEALKAEAAAAKTAATATQAAAAHAKAKEPAPKAKQPAPKAKEPAPKAKQPAPKAKQANAKQDAVEAGKPPSEK